MGPGENAMSLTAPNSAFGREVVNEVINGSTPGVARAATLKIEMVPYWVPTARYVPVLEKHAAKLPLLLVSDHMSSSATGWRHEPVIRPVVFALTLELDSTACIPLVGRAVSYPDRRSSLRLLLSPFVDIQVGVIADSNEKPAVGRDNPAIHELGVCDLVQSLLIPKANHDNGSVVVGQHSNALVVRSLERLGQCWWEPERDAVYPILSKASTLCHEVLLRGSFC
jgi:hypothetical protein